ncbi:unnamed protein product [Musa banksii]
MENFHAPWISFVLLALVPFLSKNPLVAFCHNTPNHETDQPRTYIIQLETPTASLDEESLKIWYKSFLPDSNDNSERLLHSYSEVFSGFAAKLTEEEVKNMAKKEGFLRAHPDRVLPLHTTHTADFLGLKVGQGLWQASGLGKGVIIGVLDSGITPNHPSFDDRGVPPPPPGKWKGSCNLKTGCNNKLIGAKSLVAGDTAKPPIDVYGHGTHTSSTAAGNFVRNASAFGLARGTAAGTAPHAHLAIYKVCNDDGCSESAVVAGFDAAVKDGVDVISMSLGGSPTRFDQDPVSIAAFRASVEKGVFVSCSAGNDGPFKSTLSSVAPWVLTVAATTMDRSLQATVELGDGRKINAESMDQPLNFPEGPVPLFITDTSYDYHNCYTVSEKVKGKVAVCQADDLICTGKAANVKAAGGIGMIVVNLDEEGYTMVDRTCNFPTASVPFNDGNPIITYVNSTSNATATISFRGTVLGVTPAPAIAHFSSRGPARECYSIIKPDISGPGVNILAAWIDRRTANDTFVIQSGTSMAAPHLSGVAALVKSLHPDWSAAAIKSAIMTTSDDKDRQGRFIQDEQRGSASFYAMGAGHVNPSKAVDPGLVYDLDIDDYIAYICGKYGDAGAKAIVRGRSIKCETVKNLTEAQLNYPTITLTPRNINHTVSRTVTNVGPTNSSYKVKVNVPDTVFLTVEPQILNFTQVNERKSFTVSAKWTGRPVNSVEGKLRWISDKHVVRSPIVVTDRQI